MNGIVRTAIAILCGFLAMTLIVLSGTVVASSALLSDGMRGLSRDAALPALYLGSNQLLTLVAALLGGWLASRLDPKSGWRPVLGLAVLVLVMSAANQPVPRSSSGAPVAWYPWVLIVGGVTGTVLGGWLRLRPRPGVEVAPASTSEAAGA